MTAAGWFWVGVATGVTWAAVAAVLSLGLGRVFRLRDDSLAHLDDALLEDEHRHLLESEGGRS